MTSAMLSFLHILHYHIIIIIIVIPILHENTEAQPSKLLAQSHTTRFFLHQILIQAILTLNLGNKLLEICYYRR